MIKIISFRGHLVKKYEASWVARAQGPGVDGRERTEPSHVDQARPHAQSHVSHGHGRRSGHLALPVPVIFFFLRARTRNLVTHPYAGEGEKPVKVVYGASVYPPCATGFLVR